MDLSFLFFPDDDTDKGYKRPQAYFDEWLNAQSNSAVALAQLRRIVGWLIVDPLVNVVGDSSTWSGSWPDDGGSLRRYPTARDFLARMLAQDPAGRDTKEESFSWLDTEYLVPWNLEQILDPNPNQPTLGPDWQP